MLSCLRIYTAAFEIIQEEKEIPKDVKRE